MKGELEDLGEESEGIESISKIQTQILNLTKGKVNIFDDLDPTKFKSTYDIMLGISKVWNDMTQVDQAQLLETIAGKQRGNSIAALIQSMGQAENVLQTSLQSSGSAMKEQESYMKGIQYSADRLKASFQELSSNTLNSSWVKAFYDLANILTNVTDKVGLFNIGILATVGILNAKKGFFLINGIDLLITKLGVATASATGLSFALSAILPVGLALAGITAGIALYNELNQSIEKQKKVLEETKDSYAQTNSDLEKINSELKTTIERIDELNAKDNLTFVEQSELDKLKETNKHLLIQQDILNKNKNTELKDIALKSANLVDSQYGKNNIDQSSIDEYIKNSNTTGNNAILLSDSGNLASMIAGYKEFNDLLEESYGSKNQEDIEHFTGLVDGISESLYNSLGDLQTNKDDIQEYYNTIKNIPYNELDSNQKKIVDSYNLINNAIELVYKNLDPNKWKEIQISSIFDSNDIEKTKEELVEMANSGEISENVLQSYPKLMAQLDSAGISVSEFMNQLEALKTTQENISTPEIFNESTISDAIESLTGINDAMSLMDKTYAKFIDDKKNIDFSDIEALSKAFKDFVSTDTLENVASVLGNTSSTADQVQQAFSNLTTEYINQSGVLDNLSFKTADFVAQQLRAMGIANAEEVVYASLGLTIDQYSQLKSIATARGIDLTNITYQEVQALLNEQQITNDTAQVMYTFALRKALANEHVLDTSADIENLRNLVVALGGTTTALDIYNNMKAGLDSTLPGIQKNMMQQGVNTAKNNAMEEAKQNLNNISSSMNSLSKAAPKINYQGGADTAKALENNLKKAKDAAREAEDALKKAYDEYTKLMSHKEAMGIYEREPMQYVKDLGTLVNKYVYDQETAWAAEEKIYQAREKYLDEWMSKSKEVYADYLDMLDVYQQQLQNKITLANNNASKSTYNKLFKTFVDEAKKYAEERNYLEKQLSDYIAQGGSKTDERGKGLLKSIAEANTKIDETKIALKNLADSYRNDWLDAIDNVYSRQISSLDNYTSRLQDLYDLTGDSKYLSEMATNYQDTLDEYANKLNYIKSQMDAQLKSGLISTDPTSGAAYDGYLKMLDTINGIDDSINKTKKDIKSLADTSLGNWIDSISKLGSESTSLLADYQKQLKSFISEIESSGEIVGSSLYDALISSTQDNISVYSTRLNTLKQQLQYGLDNGLIVKYDKNWQELVSSINEASQAILDAQVDINGFNDSLMKLDFSKFDVLLKKVTSISSEIENILSVIDKADTVLVDKGANFTDDGLTTIALNLQQREVGEYNLSQIKDEIAKLQAQYKSGTFDMSEDEYLERLSELQSDQYGWIEKIQSAEKNVLDIYEQQKDAQIQIIQDKIDALQKENDEYQKSLDLQKAKYALEKAMNNRDTMVFNGTEFEYTTNKESIDSARDTYNDLQFKKQISDLESQIDLLKKTVLKLDDVIGDAIDEVNDRSEEIYEKLIQYAEQYGITISDEIISAWNGVSDSETNAKNALTQFGNTVTSTSSKSVSALNTVKVKINEIYTSANTTSSALVQMLTPNTQYINEAMAKIQNDINIISNNANTAKSAMDNWNNVDLSTFNRTTENASNGINAVETAARNANGALSALNNIDVYTNSGRTKKDIESLRDSIVDGKGEVDSLKSALEALGKIDVTAKVKVNVTGAKAATDLANTIAGLKDKTVKIDYIQDIHTALYRIKGVKDGFSSYAEAWNWMAANIPAGYGQGLVIEAYAQGGKIGNTKNTLTSLANSVGEDTMVAVKHGEEILTNEQSNAWRSMLELLLLSLVQFQP